MFYIFIWICIHILNTESSCLFPTTWKDKTFKDSSSGSVTENIHFYGGFVRWPFTVYGTNIDMWNCHDSNENEIVIKGSITVTHNSQTLHAYRCLLYTDTPNSLFYYFPARDVADGSRVILSTSPSLSICDVCSSIEPELHTMSLLASCDCTPPCSDLTTTGTCSQTVDLSNVQCTLSATTTTTSATTTTTVSSNIPTTAGPATPVVSTASPSSSNTSNTTSKNSEDVFTVEVIVILCASLLVLCLILVTSTVAIVIYNRNEQLRRQFLKVRKVRPAETA